MEIRTIENKDYLVSSVVTGKYRWADTTKLFDDMWEFIELLREYHKTDTMVKTGYGSNVEHIYRKYNTDYFSPTFLKSFNENPFGCLIHDIYSTGEMDARGINFHKVMELYYKLPKGERTREMEITGIYLNLPKKVKDYYVRVNRSKKIDEVVFSSMCEQFCKRYEKFKKDRLLFPKPIGWCYNLREKEIINNMAKGVVGTEEEILIPLGETNNDIKDFIIS